MKRILCAILTLMATAATAQVKQGTITYERKVNLHKAISDEQMKAMVPEFRTSKHQLLFNDSVSLYKTIPEDEAPDPFDNNGGGVRTVVRFGGGNNDETYTNFAGHTTLKQTELGSKTYLVQDSIRKQQWKLTDETKKILGYTCRKAVTTQKMVIRNTTIRTVQTGGNTSTDSAKTTNPKNEDLEVVAWYAEDIVTPAGPDNNGGLPGVILQLDINNGQTVYTATEVSKNYSQKDLKQPTKGKKITGKEFTTLQEEMLQNMMGGGSGGRTFRFGN
jgi:GLPGLI family protein